MARVVRQSPTIRQTIEIPREEEPPRLTLTNQEDKAAEFWETIAAVCNDGKHFAYLYRDTPRSNTKGSAMLEKITRPFDPEWVRQKYGGYDYRAMLCGEDSKIEQTLSFSIDATPKNVGEAPAPAANPAPAVSDFQTQVLTVIRESNNETRQLLRELISSRQGSGGNNADTISAAVGGLVDIFVKQVPQAKDPLETLKLLREINPQPDTLALLKQAKELFAPAGGTSGNMVDQVTAVLAVADKLSDTFGGSRKTSVGVAIVDKLAEHVPTIIEGVKDIAAKWSKAAELNNMTSQYRYAAAVAINRGQPAPLAAPGALPIVPGTAGPGTVAHYNAVTPQPPPAATVLDVEPLNGAMPPPPGPPTLDAAGFDLLPIVKDRVVASIARGDEGGVIVDFLHCMDERLVQAFTAVPLPDLEKFFESDPILVQATVMPRFHQTLREIVDVLNEEGAEEETRADALPN